MKAIFLICAYILLAHANWAQAIEPHKSAESTEVIRTLTKKPEFQGNINQFISNNLIYPEIALENDIEGTVILQFVVEKDGTVSKIKKLNNGVHESLVKEAIRVLKLTSGKWLPGKDGNETVEAYLKIPIRFKLMNDVIQEEEK